MKTLYININSEKIGPSDTLDVLEYDLINDFYFVLGEKILTTCPVIGVDKIKLFTDYIDTDSSAGTDAILEQWSQLKTQLLGESHQLPFTVYLPDSYLSWLKYNGNPDYCRLAEKLSSRIEIDLEEFYEDSIDCLKRRILRYLHKEDRYKEIDEIVFNDYAVARKSAIVRAIKEKYEDIGFMSYEKWLRENEEKLHTSPQVCDKCKKNPCECNTRDNDLFPFQNVVLGETSIDAIAVGDKLEDNGFKTVDCADGVNFITNPYSDKIVTLHLKEVPVIGYEFPKILSEKLGVNWRTSYDECQKELLKRNYTIRLKRKDVEIDDENCTIIVADSPNHKYLLEFIFEHSSRRKSKAYLNQVYVHLKKCPICGEERIYIVTDEYPFTYQCKNIRCGHEWTLIPHDIDNEVGTPSCPNCSSDDVEDDGSDYLQYTCNDCGHNWGHDDTVECPECGSDDVENDGTDNLQYECNTCGHMWGDDEYDDNDDEYEGDTDNEGNEMSEYYEVLNIIPGTTSKYDILRQGGVFVESEIKNADYYKMPNGSRVQLDADDKVCVIRYVKDSWINIPPFYTKLGLYWDMDKARFRNIFENLGFDVYDYNSIITRASKRCVKCGKDICIDITHIGGDMTSLSIW